MKTHADVVDYLKTMENTLRNKFAVSEMGLVSAHVEYKPVSAVRLFVVGPAPDQYGPLASHLADELGLDVEVISKTSANGAFRYVLTPPRP